MLNLNVKFWFFSNFFNTCFVLVFGFNMFIHKITTLRITDVDTTYLTIGFQFLNQRSPNIH